MDNEYFKSKEFKEILKKYEEAESGKSVFLDAGDMTDVAEYFNIIGQSRKSLMIADEAVENFPGAVKPLAFRARLALFLHDDIAEAKRYVDMIDDKSNLEYYYVEAEIMVAQNKVADANDYLAALIPTVDDEDLEDYYLDVALLFADYNCLDVAEEWLKRSSYTDDLDYLDVESRIAYSRRELGKCEKLYNKMLDEDAYNAHLWYQLANTEYGLGKLPDALQSCDYALAISPNDGETLLLRAIVLIELGNYDEAVATLDKTDHLKADHAEANVLRGRILLEKGDAAGAVERFRLALEESGHNFFTCLAVAVAFYEAGNYKEAYAMLKGLLDTPDGKAYNVGWAQLAVCVKELGRGDDEFRHCVEEAVKTSPDETREVLKDYFPKGMDPNDYVAYLNFKH